LQSNSARSFRITNPARLALNVRRWGRGPADAILLHGFGDGGYVWDECARGLASQLPLMALDLRGHGDSDWDPLHRYSVTAHVSDAITMLTSTGRHEPILIGHSMGAHIAARIAASSAIRARALVIVDAVTEPNAAGVLEFQRRFIEQSWQYPSVLAYTTHLQQQLPLASHPVLARFAQSAMRGGDEEGYRLKCDPALKACMSRAADRQFRELLLSVDCPILIMHGAASAVCNKHAAERLTRCLPRAVMTTIPIAGHAVMLDNPSHFASALQTFLASLPARPVPELSRSLERHP
jgi:pimeloyl-ACP methyl ester carboxylesterase